MIVSALRCAARGAAGARKNLLIDLYAALKGRSSTVRKNASSVEKPYRKDSKEKGEAKKQISKAISQNKRRRKKAALST